MAAWGIAGVVYGLALALAAVTQPIRRPAVAFVATVAYALVAAGAATLAASLWVSLLVPGALLLVGYWLSGLLFHSPQPWLESWLLRTDQALAADRWMARVPRPIAELLEASYAADYVVVGGGAIYMATLGSDAVAYYWSLVLTSELASYGPLPWLRSRPPRALEPPCQQTLAEGPYLRRLNTLILDKASVQANTIPSGHVSGAMAAALGIMTVEPVLGWSVMAIAVLIAIAAVAGRYHYVVDCVAGAGVALAVWSVM